VTSFGQSGDGRLGTHRPPNVSGFSVFALGRAEHLVPGRGGEIFRSLSLAFLGSHHPNGHHPNGYQVPHDPIGDIPEDITPLMVLPVLRQYDVHVTLPYQAVTSVDGSQVGSRIAIASTMQPLPPAVSENLIVTWSKPPLMSSS